MGHDKLVPFESCIKRHLDVYLETNDTALFTSKKASYPFQAVTNWLGHYTHHVLCVKDARGESQIVWVATNQCPC